MNNNSVTPTERERRNEASAGTHGGVEVLDADRPRTPGAPNITHQTVDDPYRAEAAPVDRSPRTVGQGPIDPDHRPVVTPPADPTPASTGINWGMLLTAIVVILAGIWLLTWIF
ncbi:MAG: hypothetical protein R2932_34215 [Caldilineaceae bacterium]